MNVSPEGKWQLGDQYMETMPVKSEERNSDLPHNLEKNPKRFSFLWHFDDLDPLSLFLLHLRV